MFIVTCVKTTLSAFFYRIGGMSKAEAAKYFPWWPQCLVKSWVRDIGCSFLTVSWAMCLPAIAWWRFILALILTYLALTTYWDKSDNKWKDAFCRKFNWRYPEDNFYLHGLFIGIAYMPISFTWLALGRAVVLSVFMGVLCHVLKWAFFKNVFTQEYGRGGAIIVTLPITL